MADPITSDQTKSVNNPVQNNVKQEIVDHPFRGAAIHIKEDGTFAVELAGITPMELYGALHLVTEKVKKQLNGSQ